MGLVCVASAKGAPGVTTAALMLGALWPRDVVVAECDVSGADVPLRVPAADGGVVDPERGLLSLGAAARRGLTPDLVTDHTQEISGGLRVVAGPRGVQQAKGLTNLWPQLTQVFSQMPGCDVVADCGRLTGETGQGSLLRGAQMVLLVTTARPSEVAHVRQAVVNLAQELNPASPNGTPLGVAVVAPVKASRQVAEVRQVLERTEAPLRGVWHVAQDRAGAGAFSGEARGRPERTPYVRTMRTVAAELAEITAPFFTAPQGLGDPAASRRDEPEEPTSKRGRRRRRKAQQAEERA